LQQRVEQALTALGFPQEERPFSPHVTLGRVRETASGRERQRLREALEEAPPPPPLPWQVEGLNLMQSTLAPSGAVYRRLRHIPLG
ncbi:MAG: 2'-5' RNA ligase family protein, partial [Dehalococcoidia bacterium]